MAHVYSPRTADFLGLDEKTGAALARSEEAKRTFEGYVKDKQLSRKAVKGLSDCLTTDVCIHMRAGEHGKGRDCIEKKKEYLEQGSMPNQLALRLLYGHCEKKTGSVAAGNQRIEKTVKEFADSKLKCGHGMWRGTGLFGAEFNFGLKKSCLVKLKSLLTPQDLRPAGESIAKILDLFP